MIKLKMKNKNELCVVDDGECGSKHQASPMEVVHSVNNVTNHCSQICENDSSQIYVEQQNQENLAAEVKLLKKKKKVKKEKNVEVKVKDTKMLKKKALKYLKLWKKDRANWKFEKLRQVWLLQNMFNEAMISERKFSLLVEYVAPAKGRARKYVMDSASKIVMNMEKWTELSDQGLTDAAIMAKNPALEKVDKVAYNRARHILQSLQDD